MTQARRQLVDPTQAGTYHCINRCVRRSWLCGEDELTKKSFEHRKPWVEKRILELGTIFACGIYSYAVMSNHLHLVVHMSPQTSNAWTPDEVAARWVRLYPAHTAELCAQKAAGQDSARTSTPQICLTRIQRQRADIHPSDLPYTNPSR